MFKKMVTFALDCFAVKRIVGLVADNLAAVITSGGRLEKTIAFMLVR
jgi:hypothetical protein